ncbi:uncharacterized protein LOC112993714 isoform X2 [Dromaius novaehollandiae]|uniref:uncharacterized protein LOC112993714 isoform X2 n=1 Tax=Dromaius novaehollandiae TaxID=8790 RepID=UPI00311D7EA8
MRPGLLCAFAAAFLAVAGADHGNSKKAKTEIREKEVGTSVPGKRRPYRPCSGCFSVLSEESNPLSRSTREVEEVQQSIWPPKRKPGKKNPEGRRPPQSQSYETDVLRGARRREQPGEQRRVKREDKKPSRVQPVRKPGGSSVVRKRTPAEQDGAGTAARSSRRPSWEHKAASQRQDQTEGRKAGKQQ